MSKKRVHIVPHTHWDKEWYFTASRSKVYLMRQVQEIMEVLTNNPRYTSFLLDGQTSLVEDYLRYYPEHEALLKELIRTKRLLIGPWYTQTDQLVISAESIVRNLYYGIKGAQQLGHAMSVGYAPDAFGQGANMPQIYQHFGIDTLLFWRGIADDRLAQLEFIWEGADSSQVLANQMYFAYYYGLNIPQNPDTLVDYIDSVIPPLEARASSEVLYFPSGGDQSAIQANLVEVVSAMNQKDPSRDYCLSNPEQFFDELKQSAQSLPIIKGEMIEGKNSRIHKSIYSTRADLKQANNRIENQLTNVLEPLLAISFSLGNRYPHKEIEEIWKLLFENAAHDSIGGCNSDETNQDIKGRYKLAEDLVKNLLDLHMREIAMAIQQNQKYALTIYNTLPYQRSSILETDLYIPDGDFKLVDEAGNEVAFSILSKVDQSDYLLNQFAYLTPHLYRKEMGDQYIPDKVYFARLQIVVPEVPAMGYCQLYLLPDEPGLLASPLETNDDHWIENEHYRVQYDPERNSFSVTHKASNVSYDRQFVVLDNGDDGDSYNYSPPREDWVLSSETDAQNIQIIAEKNQLGDSLLLRYDLILPADLKQRAAKIQSVTVPVTQRISLRQGEKIVRVGLTVDNLAKDHRMCLHQSTNIQTDQSLADKLFGVETMDMHHPAMDYWQEDKWTEAPIAINPLQSFVALSDQQATVAVMTEGVREYEIVGEHYSNIQLTLFRCFGYMGKENLVYRPGRASGEKIVATPDAQLLGPLSFEVAVAYEDGSFDEVAIAKLSKEYLTPLQQYELTDFLNGRTIFKKNMPAKTLAPHYSLLDFAESDVILSTLKKSELGDNLVYRVYNPFIQKEVSLEGVIKETDVAVGLDEITQLARPQHLTHNQFQTFVRN